MYHHPSQNAYRSSCGNICLCDAVRKYKELDMERDMAESGYSW